MPVNLTAPDVASLLPVAGVELGTARAGIRKPGRRDLLVVRLAEGRTPKRIVVVPGRLVNVVL